MDTSAAAAAIKNETLSLFELALLNNPHSVVEALRAKGLTKSVTPKHEEIGRIIKRLITTKDKNTIRELLTNIKFDSRGDERTVSPELWTALGVTPGDYVTIFNLHNIR